MADSTLIADLIGVRSLIDAPTKWCQMALFEGPDGEGLHSEGKWHSKHVPPEVARMCINGAKIKFGLYDEGYRSERSEMFDRVFCEANSALNLKCGGGGSAFTPDHYNYKMVVFNNDRKTTHGMMMDALDRTIAYASEHAL